jgi:hypothetical protein
MPDGKSYSIKDGKFSKVLVVPIVDGQELEIPINTSDPILHEYIASHIKLQVMMLLLRESMILRDEVELKRLSKNITP